MTEPLYDLCKLCWHFVDYNDSYGDYPGLAEYIHLDDGEKEHDHDAQPTGEPRPLDVWKVTNPSLFTTYADGKIGPNSSDFKPRRKIS